MRHSQLFVILFAAVACVAATPALAQDDARNQGRQEDRDMAQQALADLYQASPPTKYAIEHAAGYGVFGTIGMKLLFAGGTRGAGIVVNNRTHAETFMKMLQVQGGLGFGISRMNVIFVFQTEEALRTFVDQGWEFGGSGNLAAADAGQGGSLAGAVSVMPGVYVYQMTDEGLAATLTIAGTKFYIDSDLN